MEPKALQLYKDKLQNRAKLAHLLIFIISNASLLHTSFTWLVIWISATDFKFDIKNCCKMLSYYQEHFVCLIETRKVYWGAF